MRIMICLFFFPSVVKNEKEPIKFNKLRCIKKRDEKRYAIHEYFRNYREAEKIFR